MISKKKEELDNVLDQFNIQVDNPVVIMSQDTARNFLPSTGGHEKYKVNIIQTTVQRPRHVVKLYHR